MLEFVATEEPLVIPDVDCACDENRTHLQVWEATMEPTNNIIAGDGETGGERGAFHVPSTASRKKRRHQLLVTRRQQSEAFGPSAISLYDFMWDGPIDVATLVAIRSEELTVCEQKGFKLMMCGCVMHCERNFYKCIKADVFDIHAMCMQCTSLEEITSLHKGTVSESYTS